MKNHLGQVWVLQDVFQPVLGCLSLALSLFRFVLVHLLEGITGKVVEEWCTVHEVSFLHVTLVESTVFNLLLEYFIHILYDILS